MYFYTWIQFLFMKKQKNSLFKANHDFRILKTIRHCFLSEMKKGKQIIVRITDDKNTYISFVFFFIKTDNNKINYVLKKWKRIESETTSDFVI